MSGSIVVTGASGFIGRSLTARLKAENRVVVALGRSEISEGAKAVDAILSGADCVVHLAARAHRRGTDADFEPDVALAEVLARACIRSGVKRVVLMSSIGVLGTTTAGAPFSESSAPNPVEAYARAKLRAEHAMQRELASSQTGLVILRPPMVYGPHAPGNFARLVQAVRRGWPLPFAHVRNRRFLLGVDNLLDAALLCIDEPAARGQTFLVADDEPVSTPGLVSLIAQGLGATPRLWPAPPALLRALATATGRRRMADSLLGDLLIDSGHIRRALGWHPRVGAHAGIVDAASASRT